MEKGDYLEMKTKFKVIPVFVSCLIISIILAICKNNGINMIDYDAYGWEVPIIKNESYEEYYSKLHVYYQRSNNQLLFKEKNKSNDVLCNKDGITMEVTTYDDVKNTYKIADGDYRNYQYISYFSDGYWFYFYVLDEGEKVQQFVRVNLKCEKQTIIEDMGRSDLTDVEGNLFPAEIIDHNVMLIACTNVKGVVIKRIYLPDMTIESIETPISIFKGFLEQINSNHIYYLGINPEYHKKYMELKSDKDFSDTLLEKYKLINIHPKVKEKYLDTETNEFIRYIIYKEYGVSMYCSYSYDFVTKETKETVLEENISFPTISQGFGK